MKSRVLLIAVALGALLLAGCAPGANELLDTPNAKGEIAGFWMGLWHGAITPVTFVISLFTNNVSYYEVHNSGGWYDFGFVIGLSMVFGGGGGAGGAASRRKR